MLELVIWAYVRPLEQQATRLLLPKWSNVVVNLSFAPTTFEHAFSIQTQTLTLVSRNSKLFSVVL